MRINYLTVLLLLDVLIETLWNVNMKKFNEKYGACRVLIETLWNVNIGAKTYSRKEPNVLIETLWNVNLTTAFTMW